MADLSITASQVLIVGVPVRAQKVAATGVTITAGAILYADVNDEWQLAHANGLVNEAEATHIAENGASPGQSCTGALLQNLLVTLGAGAAPVAGTGYWLSATAGNHAPEADLVSTNYGTFLGIGVSNNQVRYNVLASGVQKP